MTRFTFERQHHFYNAKKEVESLHHPHSNIIKIKSFTSPCQLGKIQAAEEDHVK